MDKRAKSDLKMVSGVKLKKDLYVYLAEALGANG